MGASWRDIKNRTMTKGHQARAHALAMRDLREMELRDLREELQITQVAHAKKLKPMAVRSGKSPPRGDRARNAPLSKPKR